MIICDFYRGAGKVGNRRGNNESDREESHIYMCWLFILIHGRIQNAAVILFHGQNRKNELRKKIMM